MRFHRLFTTSKPHTVAPTGVTSLLVIIVVLAGCGGPRVVIPGPRTPPPEDPPAPPPQVIVIQQAPPAPPPPVAKAPVPDAKQAADAKAISDSKNVVSKTGEDPFAGKTAAATPPPRIRPVDISTWNSNDYRSAKWEKDKRLINSVAFLNRDEDKIDENAKLLSELLRPDPSFTPTDAQAEAIPNLAKNVVAALGVNKSETARNALKEIILGRLTSDVDDRTLTLAALKALADNPNPENELVLYTVMVAPEAVRPPGRGSLPPEVLQQECIALVKKTASFELRKKLAEYVVKDSTPIGHRDRLVPLLTEARPENVGAFGVLAGGGSVMAQYRPAVLKYLTARAKVAMDGLWGLPPTTTARVAGVDDEPLIRTLVATVPVRPEDHYRAIDALWNQQAIDRIAQQIDGLGHAAGDPDLLSLATSIPASDLRTALRKQLQKNWIDGDTLTKLPQFAAVGVRDPGYLLVMKSLPREDAWAKTKPMKTGTPGAQKVLQERKARQAWMISSSTMASSLMRRFEIIALRKKFEAAYRADPTVVKPLQSAADFEKLAAGAAEPESQGTKALAEPAAHKLGMPLELPEGAEVFCAHQVDWPQDLEGKLQAPVSHLQIRYARVHLYDQGTKAVDFFEKQLRGSQQHPIENGRWIDSVSRPSPGKLRSVDCMVTRANPAAAVAAKSAESLIVDLLWIEIDDFTLNEQNVSDR